MGKDGTKLTVSEMVQNKNVAGMGYEERLEIIRRLNEDLKACGINQMTEEQMQDLAMDRTKIINYKKAQHFEKEQKKIKRKRNDILHITSVFRPRHHTAGGFIL